MKIIKNPHILTKNYLPPKLLYRDGLINHIERKIKLGVGNQLLVGDTGCGKTASINAVISRNKEIIFIFINCSVDNTYGSIARRIISTLRKQPYSESGKSRSQIGEDLIKVVSSKLRKKKVVYVFDEIDKLLEKERDHQEVLIPILENTDSNIIVISNKTEALKNLEPRILSRLNPEKHRVERYNFQELLSILQERVKEGLKRKSHQPESIARIAKICFETTGDIRDALSILFESAQIAEEKQHLITLEIVNEAYKRVQAIRLESEIDGLTKHQRVIVIGVAKLSLEMRKGFAELNELYNFYFRTLFRESVKPVDRRQFDNLLSKIELIGLIKREIRYVKGYKGRISLITSPHNPQDILKIYYPEALKENA